MIVPFSRPLIGDEERAAVDEVLRGSILTNGGRVRAFEEAFQDFAGGGMAVAVSSCTAALHMSCLALGIGPGDEVIVPALTHVATANAVELTGASCRFVDSHQESGNLDPDLLEPISKNTKAIIVVHFLGRPGYMRSVLAIARKHNLAVIEDCAHALGAHHNDIHVGLIGDVGCFSFYPCKNITTGEGGMLLTRRPEIAERARELREFGKREYPVTGDLRSWQKIHNYDFASVGLNYRMTEIAGAIGFRQLPRVAAWARERAFNYEVLKTAFLSMGMEVLDSVGTQGASHYAISALIEPSIREDLRRGLFNDLIETSIYYPKPVPYWGHYQQKYGARKGSVPVSEEIAGRSITFPVGPHLKKKHIELIVKSMNGHLSKLGENCKQSSLITA